jgi:hypothetical protein
MWKALMNTQNPHATLQQASVIDIVTFGYKAGLKSIGPITRLILPIILLYAVSTTSVYTISNEMKAGVQPGVTHWVLLVGMGLLSVVSWIGYVYLSYPITRYVRDVYWNEIDENLYSYLIPRRSLLGCWGIGLLWGLMLLPVSLLGMVGLLLLIVPGVAVFSYYYSMYSLLIAGYMSDPDRGAFSAISEVFGLLKGNFWRTVALGVMTWLIYISMSGMMIGLQMGLELLQEFSPSLTRNLWYPLAYGTLTGVICWFSMAVGHGTVLFVMYRYLFDLRTRAQVTAPIDLAAYQGRSNSSAGNG